MSNPKNITTGNSGAFASSCSFDERWYTLALEKLAVECSIDFEKSWEMPPDIEFFGAPAYLFPATELALAALYNFGEKLLSNCLEMLQSYPATDTSTFIRTELQPRLLNELRIRKNQIVDRISRPLIDAGTRDMLLRGLDSRTERLERQIEKELEITAIKLEHKYGGLQSMSQPSIASDPVMWVDIKHLSRVKVSWVAKALKVDSRTIRNYVQKGTLDRPKRGWITVNQKLHLEMKTAS